MKNVLQAGKHLPPTMIFLGIFWQRDHPESIRAAAGGRQQTVCSSAVGSLEPLPPRQGPPQRGMPARLPRAARCGSGRGQRRAGPPESLRELGEGGKGVRKGFPHRANCNYLGCIPALNSRTCNVQHQKGTLVNSPPLMGNS